MNLKRVDIFQAKTIRGAPKMPTELRYCIEVRLLRRRRQIADRHVLDHAAAKRADLSHRKTSCLKGGAAKNPRTPPTREPTPAPPLNPPPRRLLTPLPKIPYENTPKPIKKNNPPPPPPPPRHSLRSCGEGNPKPCCRRGAPTTGAFS